MSFAFGIAKSFFGLPSGLLFSRGAKYPSFMSSFHDKESKAREQVELMLHVASYLILDDGMLVGMNKNTSAIPVDVT